MKPATWKRRSEKLDREIAKLVKGVASAQTTPKKARVQLREINEELKSLKSALKESGFSS